MSKKRKARGQKPPVPQRRGWKMRKRMPALVIVLSLSVAGIVLARWGSLRRVITPLSTVPQTTSTPQLSKEYIYAGGRLLATEEPEVTLLAAPSSLTAAGASLPSAQVTLTWPASTSNTVDHYQVERCSNITTSNCYTVVAANVPATGSTITYTDTITGSSGVTAYLYRVRAANSSNTNFSDYTIDLATTITFTDGQLTAGVTPIKAVHLTELRQAVNAVRALAGLGQASWTYPDPVSTPVAQRRVIHWQDVAEMRSKLDEALNPLNRVQAYPATPAVASGAPIKAVHFTQIRDRVQ